MELSDGEGSDDVLIEREFVFVSADYDSRLSPEPPEGNFPEAKDETLAEEEESREDVCAEKEEGDSFSTEKSDSVTTEKSDSIAIEKSDTISIREQKVEIELVHQELHQDTTDELSKDDVNALDECVENEEDDSFSTDESDSVGIEEHKVDIQLLQQELHQTVKKEETDATRSEEVPSNSQPGQLHEQVFGAGITYEEALQHAWKLLKETDYLSDNDYSDIAPDHQVAGPSGTGAKSREKRTPSEESNDSAEDEESPLEESNESACASSQNHPGASEDRVKISCVSSRKQQSLVEERSDVCQEEEGPSEESKKNVCPMCGKENRTPHLLELHMLTHTRTLFKCLLCAKNFFSRESRDRHILIHFEGEPEASNNNDPKPLHGKKKKKNSDFPSGVTTRKVPNHCAKFKSSTDLQIHLLTGFQSNIRICEICKESCIGRSHFLHHLYSHVTKDQPVLVCPLCTEPFETKLGLNKHLHGHTRAMPHHASASSTAESNKEPAAHLTKDTRAAKSNKRLGELKNTSYLLQRIAPHNPDSKSQTLTTRRMKAEKKEKNTALKREKKREGVQKESGAIRKSSVQASMSKGLFKCERCPREFNNRSDWLRHLKYPHSRITLSQVLKLFECTKCPRKYTNNSNLLRHLRTEHSGSKSKASSIKIVNKKKC